MAEMIISFPTDSLALASIFMLTPVQSWENGHVPLNTRVIFREEPDNLKQFRACLRFWELKTPRKRTLRKLEKNCVNQLAVSPSTCDTECFILNSL